MPITLTAPAQVAVLNPVSHLFDIVTGVSTSAGAADAYKPVTLDANGNLGVESLRPPSPPTRTSDDVYTVLPDDDWILADGNVPSGAQDILLPVTGIPAGKTFIIKNISTGIVILECVDLTTMIDFSTFTSSSNEGDALTVRWDGTQYWIIAFYSSI